MIKNFPEEGFKLLIAHIQQFWEEAGCDYEIWLMMLHKGNGSSHDPNNWRGICQKETSAKIVSTMQAKGLLKNLKDTKLEQINSVTLFAKKDFTPSNLPYYSGDSMASKLMPSSLI